MLCCRALDGDVVAVELLPESQWRGASAHLPQADAESTTGVEEEDGDDPEGGHIAQVWVSKPKLGFLGRACFPQVQGLQDAEVG